MSQQNRPGIPPRLNGTHPPLNHTHPPPSHPPLNGTHPPLNHTLPAHPIHVRRIPPSDTVVAIWWSASILVLVILVTLAITLIVFYFKKSCKVPSNKSGKIFIGFFVISLLFWLIEAALTLTNIILTSDRSTASLMSDWLGILPKLFYNLARLVMLFYFIIKSYVVFHNSAYSVSKAFVWILFILSLIAFGFQVAPLIYNQVTGDKTRSTIYFLCIGWGIDVVVSIAAMYKFVAILFTLSLRGIEHSDKRSNQTQIHLNSVQMRMMKTISRTTVLSIFAVLSSVVFGFFFNPYPLINTKAYGNHLNVAAVSDSALNAICMFLSYAFTTKQYGFCCKYCDIGIGNLCIWCTKKALQRKSGKTSKDVIREIEIDTTRNTDTNSRTSALAQHEDPSRLAIPSKSSNAHHQSLESQSVTNE